jgi:hypothetical protein
MLAFFAFLDAVVDPVARQAEFIDQLVERGRDLLKDAPPSTLRRTGLAISRIANTFPDSTFATVANAAMERVSSAPTFAELHKYAINGQLTSVVRANARSLMSVPWHRRLQDDEDLAGMLTNLQTTLKCASTTPPPELTDEINGLVKAFLYEADDFTADSTQLQAFVNDAWGCFCGLSLSGTAGRKIQAPVHDKLQHRT